MRLQKLGGADDVLDQIETLIKEYRSVRSRVIHDSDIENWGAYEALNGEAIYWIHLEMFLCNHLDMLTSH